MEPVTYAAEIEQRVEGQEGEDVVVHFVGEERVFHRRDIMVRVQSR